MKSGGGRGGSEVTTRDGDDRRVKETAETRDEGEKKGGQKTREGEKGRSVITFDL